MLPRLWYARWKKVAWLRMLVSGMTCEPSMPDPLLGPWIASWRRIPVNPSPAPAGGKASLTRATSGPISRESSESASLPWCSSKMYADICASDSSASAEIFKRWAIKLGRDYSHLKRWARHTAASDCSPWPSPDAQNMNEGDTRFMERRAELKARGINGNGAGIPLAVSAEHWGTPNAADAIAGNRPLDGKRGLGLNTDAAQWQTPGTDSFRSRGGDRVNEMGLDQEARNWQSPQGRDFRSREIARETAAKHAGSRPLNEEVLNWGTPKIGTNTGHGQTEPTRGSRLEDQCQNWPTARAEDGESCGNHPGAVDSLRGAVENWSTPYGAMGQEKDGSYGAGGEHADEANNWNVPTIFPLTEQATSTDGPMCWCGLPGCVLRLHKRKLNVYFDEWLIGWPVNWSSAEKESIGFEQWEKESSRLLWHLLSSYWQRSTVSTLEGQGSLF